ncbi:MAG: hypothetical protein JSR33_14040 [Proteobacteria bacterium]|nr:hypothetical protein [Pseudomonadota bacterium]
MFIHCDDELMNRFDPESELREAVSIENQLGVLGDWHAGIISSLNRQFLLTVHTKSLYSSLDLMDYVNPHLVSQIINNLRGKILEHLNDFFTLTDYQEKGIIQPFKTIALGPIEDRRMARIIQGIVLAYQKRFLQARREAQNGEVRLWELEEDLNNTPRRNLGGATPAEILRQLVWSGLN